MATPDYDIPSYIPTKVDYVWSGGTSGTVHGSPSLSRFRYKKTVSVRTPGYNRLKARKALPFNPYSLMIAELDDPAQNWQIYIKWISGPINGTSQVNSYSGNCRSLGVNMESDFVADDPMPQAITRLIKELSLAKTNTTVAMAEASKTAGHIAKTATRIFEAFRALKKLQFGAFTNALGITASAKQVKRFKTTYNRRKKFGMKQQMSNEQSKVTSFAAETWLEYSYAWKPLLMDVYNHCEALASLAVKTDFLVRSARGSARTRGDHQISGVDSDNCFNWKVDHVSERRASIEVRYRLPSGGITSIQALGVINPLEVAWEIVPFSFVVDWFLPVGDFIRNFSAYNGLTFMAGFTTSNHTRQKVISFIANGRTVPGSADTTFTGSGSGGAKSRSTYKDRKPIYEFPLPPSLELKDPRSFAHAASAIALLQVIFLQGKR